MNSVCTILVASDLHYPVTVFQRPRSTPETGCAALVVQTILFKKVIISLIAKFCVYNLMSS